MKRLPPALAACVALAVLTGCGGHGGSGPAPGPTASSGGFPSAALPSAHAPAPGKGSTDPDDLNGDGHRDLIVPVAAHVDRETRARDERAGVVFGSAHGPDPATRAVYGRRDLGIPRAELPDPGPVDNLSAAGLTPADLDGDGFADLVATVAEQVEGDQRWGDVRNVPYVVWGSPTGPRADKRPATRLRLPTGRAPLGLNAVTRGDFDGDGHHDLAGLTEDDRGIRLLYGPFDRSGTPARTGTLPAGPDARTLVADDIDPTGRPRVTGLLVPAQNDGEQEPSTLYADPRTGRSRELRAGNAHVFGDFDGDGRRDVAVGDDGGRNDEPGDETEAPDVAGSLAVYPGDGGEPVTHRLPAPDAKARTDYGPGGYVAADPDGDGRDGILVATYDGAVLIDGDRRTPVLRQGPARIGGKERTPNQRRARPVDAADFDGDGRDELVLAWAADALFTLYGESPTHWWVTRGTSGRDAAAFATTGFVTS